MASLTEMLRSTGDEALLDERLGCVRGAIDTVVDGCERDAGYVAAARDLGASVEHIGEASRVGAVVARVAAFATGSQN